MGRRLAGFETEKGNIGVLLIIYKFHFYSVGIFFVSWCHLSLVQFFFSPINPLEIPLQIDSKASVNVPGDFMANQTKGS